MILMLFSSTAALGLDPSNEQISRSLRQVESLMMNPSTNTASAHPVSKPAKSVLTKNSSADEEVIELIQKPPNKRSKVII